MRLRLSSLAPMVLALLFIVGCGSRSAPTTQSAPFGSMAEASVHIFGRWNIVSIGLSDYPHSSSVLGHPFVQFNRGGTVSGFDGVNHFDGNFELTVSSHRLQLTQVRSNLIGVGSSAPTLLIETQRAFTRMTSGRAILYWVAGDHLELVSGDLRMSAVRI